jgi:hypothetical protein
MNIIKRVFDSKGTPLRAAIFVVLFIAEGRHPLRKRVQPGWKRTIINSIVSIPAFSLLRFLFLPAMIRLAKTSGNLRLGFNYQYEAPYFIKAAITFLCHLF